MNRRPFGKNPVLRPLISVLLMATSAMVLMTFYQFHTEIDAWSQLLLILLAGVPIALAAALQWPARLFVIFRFLALSYFVGFLAYGIIAVRDGEANTMTQAALGLLKFGIPGLLFFLASTKLHAPD